MWYMCIGPSDNEQDCSIFAGLAEVTSSAAVTNFLLSGGYLARTADEACWEATLCLLSSMSWEALCPDAVHSCGTHTLAMIEY
eukprot:5059776-Amphidinium_carterae.1